MLTVVWVAHGTVVEAHLALPWRISMPNAPAMYVYDVGPEVLGEMALGNVLEFVDAE